MIELDLRDIHLPEALPWWPLAPGWWLAVLLVGFAVALVWWLLRLRRHSLKRRCLLELKRIRGAAAAGATGSEVLAEVSGLLRRVAISRRGRSRVAALSGAAWQTCISELSRSNPFDNVQLELLGSGRFQRNPRFEVDELLSACERWIRALPRE